MPIKSGKITERHDHVLIKRRSLFALAIATFFSRCASTKGPFFRDLGNVYLLFNIYLSVAFRFLVFAPFVGLPQGVTGCRPPEVFPSPPP